MPTLLVFTWPYAVAFWSVFVWAFGAEAGVVSGRREPPSRPLDAHSKLVIVAGQGVSVMLAFAIAARVPSAALPQPAWWLLAGIVAIVCGRLLRRHCFRMLGPSFTGSVIVKPGQTVVQRGAYKYVRHPSYTAGIVLFFGVGLSLANWISLAVLLIVVPLTYAYRVRVEEQALLAVLGEPYRQYMSRTARFVPFVL